MPDHQDITSNEEQSIGDSDSMIKLEPWLVLVTVLAIVWVVYLSNSIVNMNQFEDLFAGMLLGGKAYLNSIRNPANNNLLILQQYLTGGVILSYTVVSAWFVFSAAYLKPRVRSFWRFALGFIAMVVATVVLSKSQHIFMASGWNLVSVWLLACVVVPLGTKFTKSILQCKNLAGAVAIILIQSSIAYLIPSHHFWYSFSFLIYVASVIGLGFYFGAYGELQPRKKRSITLNLRF